MTAPNPPRYWLTRVVFLRSLALLYLNAFLILLNQGKPLFGTQGLLPFDQFLKQLGGGFSSTWQAWVGLPTLFWLQPSNSFFDFLTWTGLALSALGVLGVCNSLVFAALWLIYLSFVHIGQVFYGFGWESLLLETGFLAIFLSPLLSCRAFPSLSPPSVPVIWLLRWVVFRLMFGAGLIKIRGDSCWTELTCMQYHYETQPLPNPLSIYFHHLPEWLNSFSVACTHFVELVVPWGVFGPRRIRTITGGILIFFQLLLIISGNLSWLNYITIVLCFSCFDDALWEGLFLKKVRLPKWVRDSEPPPHKARKWVIRALCLLIGGLSIQPTLNLFSPAQQMNASFDAFQIVNTYGAFGSITRHRREIILSGTSDSVLTPQSVWREYEFKCKPGSVDRSPCVMSPYHYRLDWQMWFAAMSGPEDHPWFVRLVQALLRQDPEVLSLLAEAPFSKDSAQKEPPRWIRADLYEYRFATPEVAENKLNTNLGKWWRRERIATYLPPQSLQP